MRRTAARDGRPLAPYPASNAGAPTPVANEKNGVGDGSAQNVEPLAKAASVGWEHFHSFAVLARTGSLRRAGVELNIHPSTVCRRMEALEHRLGVSLFRREHHVLRITEAGRSALEPAKRIAALIADLERTSSGVDDQLAGKVRIGVPCELAACMIEAINEFEQANTAIDVEIRSIAADTDLDGLDIDCAVAVTDHPPDHLIGRLLGRLTVAACKRGISGPARSCGGTRGVCRYPADECRGKRLRSHEAPASRCAGSNPLRRCRLRPARRSSGHGDRRVAVHVGRLRALAGTRWDRIHRAGGRVAPRAFRHPIRGAYRGCQERACRNACSPSLSARCCENATSFCIGAC